MAPGVAVYCLFNCPFLDLGVEVEHPEGKHPSFWSNMPLVCALDSRKSQ